MSEQLHTQQWLCFQLGSETYAQQVGQIREILNYIPPVPIPGALINCVEGVLNVRGEIVTIVSGQAMLGLPSQLPCAHIIVLGTENGLIGISVGEVRKITVLTPEKMMPVERRETGSPVWGTIEHVGQLLILTDFERSINELDSYE